MRSIIACCLFLGLLLSATELFAADTAAKKPNILIMLADDMGITDASCYNGRVQTARLDRLAKEGIRYTNFYSGAPNCSPSRTAMLTGRTPARVGIYDYVAADSPMRLPETEITIPKMLKPVGYSSAHFGKWHLSAYDSKHNMREGTPDKHGYDYWFGCANNAMPSHFQPNNYHRNGQRLAPLEGYSCQEVATETINWLRNRKDNKSPFFVTVWYNEPHIKWAAPEELIKKYTDAGFDKEREALYYATIENLDIASGRILDALDDLGLRENTLVIFSSDNGPEQFKTSSDPYRAKKSYVYEGGIRVPGIIRWPGHVEGGKTSDVPIGFIDLLPTIAAMTGGTVPTDRIIDGENVLPALDGKDFVRTKPLFWYFYKFDPLCALREGDYKITGTSDQQNKTKSWEFDMQDQAFMKSAKLVKFELFNLKDDPSETKNLATAEPEIFNRLKAKIIAFHEGVIQENPVWEGLPPE